MVSSLNLPCDLQCGLGLNCITTQGLDMQIIIHFPKDGREGNQHVEIQTGNDLWMDCSKGLDERSCHTNSSSRNI